METLLWKESFELGIIASSLPFIFYRLGWSWLMGFSILVLMFLIYFYRYAEFLGRFGDNVIISPACGEITDIIELDGYCLVSIFLSPFDRHTQVYPINGKVIKSVYDQNGQFKLAITRNKSHDNEKKMHYILANNGAVVKVTQIAGFLPRRITSENKVNVKAGEYLGMIKFGSRVDLMFPMKVGDTEFKRRVIVGNKLNIGDIIGLYRKID